MEWRTIFNKGFWIGLVIGVVGVIALIMENVIFFIPIIPLLFIFTQILEQFSLSNNIGLLLTGIITIFASAIIGMLINFISNKIEKKYLKIIFFIVLIISYIIIIVLTSFISFSPSP